MPPPPCKQRLTSPGLRTPGAVCGPLDTVQTASGPRPADRRTLYWWEQGPSLCYPSSCLRSGGGRLYTSSHFTSFFKIHRGSRTVSLLISSDVCDISGSQEITYMETQWSHRINHRDRPTHLSSRLEKIIFSLCSFFYTSCLFIVSPPSPSLSLSLSLTYVCVLFSLDESRWSSRPVSLELPPAVVRLSSPHTGHTEVVIRIVTTCDHMV